MQTAPARWPRALVVLVVSVGVVALLAAAAAVAGGPLPGDRVLGALVGGPAWPARTLSQLGSGWVAYPLLLVLAAVDVAAGAHVRRALHPVAVLGAAQVLEAVALVTVVRPGPGGAATAFSSGHTCAAVVCWWLVSGRARVHRGAARAAAVGVALAVALSRVALGLHWPSDVLAGALCGVAALAAAAALPAHSDGPREARARRSTHPAAWLLPAAAAAVGLLPVALTSPGERMKDLLVYAGAGGTAGGGADVYGYRTAFDMPFTYPPFAAVLSEPLSRVPWGLLQVLWAVGTVAGVVALARVAMGPVVDRLGLPVTSALLLLSAPVRSHLRFGQVGVLLVLVVAHDLLRDGPRRRGLGVGLATAVKLTPGVYLPWLLVTGQRATLRRAVLAAAGASTAGLVLLWPSAHDYLWQALWDTGRFGPNAVPGNQSLRGALLRSGLEPGSAQRLWLLGSVLLVVAAVTGARALERAGDRLGAVATLAALSVAVSPISWGHHLIWLVLPLAALVQGGRVRLAAGWAGLLMVGLPAVGARGAALPGADLPWHLLQEVHAATAVAAAVLLPLLLPGGTGPGLRTRWATRRPAPTRSVRRA